MTGLKKLVFYQAHDMVKSGRVDFSAALKIAWQLYRMKKRPKTVYCFVYEKIDGSTRLARGRFYPEIVANDVKAQHYFDLEKRDWRAFKPVNFKGIYDEIELE
jgi:hypothetical protein